ncbi:MAG TPA: hypothetical protein DCR93_36255 [Cytophagales bacterium]|nr:hypothetical protein [Cytophagales bacterium]
MMAVVLAVYVISISAVRYVPTHTAGLPVPMKLSEFGFFEGNMADQTPAEGVMPYTLNTPLFSDFASKLRFIRLPEGETVAYNDSIVLDFPVGTMIMKTFYYPKDERKPEKGRQLMETRVLLHEEEGWTAWPYIWDEDQGEAWLEVAGGNREVTWKDERGKKQALNYSIPNKNQCNGCHVSNNTLRPIGPTIRQLNGDYQYAQVNGHQLAAWRDANLLAGGPSDWAQAPRVPVWLDPADGTTDERARAWLDINCGHCHQPGGPAETSALNLHIHETDPIALGVNKKPIAAGRGSGGRLYSIVPGKPQESILLYRLDSDDPGIMMPELGRATIYPEAVTLIEQWIAEMDD